MTPCLRHIGCAGSPSHLAPGQLLVEASDTRDAFAGLPAGGALAGALAGALS